MSRESWRRAASPLLTPVVVSSGVLLLMFWSLSVGICLALPERLPFWHVAHVSGGELDCLDGYHTTELSVLACGEGCEPIPWQLDERAADGRRALDQGAEPNSDDPPGVVDGNDELLWMLEDGGRRMQVDEIPSEASCVVEMRWRLGELEGWAYALASPRPAPRSPVRYVSYAPATDRMTGARISVGFGASTPRHIAPSPILAGDEFNLLDRLKIRAFARFFGVIPLRRDEDDIQTELVAWREGPIRITRRVRQQVRLGWGLRTPIFRSDTLFYRDYGILPVHLRLNFPPTYFFRGIEIQAVLDFRGLDGWQLIVPGLDGPLATDSLSGARLDELNDIETDWFALRGSKLTIVQMLQTGATLASVRRQLVVRADSHPRKPEDVRGEAPGVGYRLTRWGAVDRGRHWFASVNYALPPEYDPLRFIDQHARQPRIDTARFSAPSQACSP